jgi:hypothetical protein
VKPTAIPSIRVIQQCQAKQRHKKGFFILKNINERQANEIKRGSDEPTE